jgi:acetoin utilization deacetylase AcuC-like enzyme
MGYSAGVSTGLCTDGRFRLHRPPGQHPERPERLVAIEAGLVEAGLTPAARPGLVAHVARPATRGELERAHDPEYLDELFATLEAGAGWLDPDTYYSDGTLQAVLHAAGATIDLSARVLDGELDNAVALVRPPGHHATRRRAMGFCLINHVAVAAEAARALGAKVAIFDWDVHHGNGTEEIFYQDPDVLYASLHEWPQYPGTGRRKDRGRGAGEGATVNVPLPAGTDGEAYLRAFEAEVAPTLERFHPDLILVSAGFDAHRDDPLGGFRLDEDTYAALTGRLQRVQPKLLMVLEGGYDLSAIARSSVRVVETLLSGP